MPTFSAMNHFAAKDKRKRERQEKQASLQRRRNIQKSIYQSSDEQSGIQSAMEKADHLAGLTAEGVAGEMLMIMFCNFCQWIFQTHYIVQKRDFAKAQSNQVAYQRDAAGRFPDIYPLDENHEPDYDQGPYAQDQDVNDADFRAAIRTNGFVPPPNWQEAQQSQLYQYLEEMVGKSALTPEQREILHKRFEEIKKGGPREDLASDKAAQMAAMQQAAARSTTLRVGGGR